MAAPTKTSENTWVLRWIVLFPCSNIRDWRASRAEKIHMKTASGPDNISPKLIGSCTTALIEHLPLIFNSCINSSTFPDDFKIAKIIPLHKQLEKNIVDHYRPIRLLNGFSEMFKRLFHKKLINFMQKHALLYQYQHGFRKSNSTTFALIEIVDGIKSYIDNGEIVIESYLDLKKLSI